MIEIEYKPVVFHLCFYDVQNLIGSPPFQLGIDSYCIETFLAANEAHQFHKVAFLYLLVPIKTKSKNDVTKGFQLTYVRK